MKIRLYSYKIEYVATVDGENKYYEAKGVVVGSSLAEATSRIFSEYECDSEKYSAKIYWIQIEEGFEENELCYEIESNEI